MTSYNPGDLVLVDFPFAGSAVSKKRPALVLLDTGDADVVLARITTQSRKSNHDVAMTQWRASGLLGPSIVRLHKIVTSEKVQVIRVLGTLQATDRQQVATVLHQTFANW